MCYWALIKRGERVSVEVIYEKKYLHIDSVDEMKQIGLEIADEPEERLSSFEEMMEKICINTTYVLMPERVRASREFVRAAIEISKLYELDTRIERRLDHISVNYSFDCGGGLRDINRLFGMADQVSFFKNINGRDITISLDFYTHAVVRNGRIASP